MYILRKIAGRPAGRPPSPRREGGDQGLCLTFLGSVGGCTIGLDAQCPWRSISRSRCRCMLQFSFHCAVSCQARPRPGDLHFRAWPAGTKCRDPIFAPMGRGSDTSRRSRSDSPRGIRHPSASDIQWAPGNVDILTRPGHSWSTTHSHIQLGTHHGRPAALPAGQREALRWQYRTGRPPPVAAGPLASSRHAFRGRRTACRRAGAGDGSGRAGLRDAGTYEMGSSPTPPWRIVGVCASCRSPG
jgi:hypothetical protein